MEQLKKGVPRPCSVWGKFFSMRFKAELNQGPLMRFSSLLVRIDIVEINNKREVVEWTKIWQALDVGHGMRSWAPGVVAVLLLGMFAKEHRSNISGVQLPVAYQAQGRQEADGAFIHLHLQGVGDLHAVLQINCSCLD